MSPTTQLPLWEGPGTWDKVVAPEMKEVNLRQAMVIAVASSAASLCLLFIVYPWSVYFCNFAYGFLVTFGSYTVVALLAGLIAGVTMSLTSFIECSASAQGVLNGLLLFAALCVIALLLGPGGIDIPDIRVRGIFFAEWKFIIFVVQVALPVSVLDALATWLLLRRRAAQLSK